MPSMFSGYSGTKPDTPLPAAPPRNSALEAKAAAAGRRQGLQAAFLGGASGGSSGGASGSGPSTASHTLTGQ